MTKVVRTRVLVLQFLALFVTGILPAFAQTPQRTPLTGPLGFIENKGQFRDQEGNPREDLQYMYIRPGIKVQLLPNTVSFELFTMEQEPRTISEALGYAEAHHLDPEDVPPAPVHYKSSRIDLQFLGANANPEIVAEEMLPDYINYYLSFTPQEGINNVLQYNKVTYKNLYKNIDLVMIACPEAYPMRSLAYDFVVHPGGNVNDIRYRYNGINNQEILENGTLETSNSLGRMFEMIPESYLLNDAGIKISQVPVSFKKEDDFIRFDVAHYDIKQSLVIDPALVWATYAGGLESDEARGLAVDSEDHVIITGRTYSSDNIATAGAYQTEKIGDIDIYIVRYNSDGTRIWGTYYGGSGLDRARACIVNKDEFIYIGAHTTSPDGIVTLGNGMHQEVFAGVEDGILAYFNPDGQRLWATYYGGEDEDIIRRLKQDYEGNVIMVGYSNSDSGIATPDAWQPVNNKHSDLILSKWTSDGELIWGTFLGGESEDHGRSVDADINGNIYINGSTGSAFGIKKNAYRDHNSGGQDYLIAKYSSTGALKWCSYWGGSEEDRGRGVRVDPMGEYVYFIGYSASDTGVTTPGTFQPVWSQGFDGQGLPTHDAVIMKWHTNGYPVWSTYLGDGSEDRGRGVTMIGNDVYFGGTTTSPTIISTPDGFQPVYGGKDDMFVEKFDSAGNRIWGSYYGGPERESVLALATDKADIHIFLVGTAESEDISTPGVAQEVFGGFDDGFLLKVQVAEGVGIQTPEVSNDMEIYPNPNQGNLSMTYRITEDATLRIYDLNGREMYTKELNAASQVLVEKNLGLIPGIYEVVIANNSKQLATKKLIIIK
ncbi:MAG: T9SS type A sorting domain-containing protein [Chitinophagaceae bacterium]|nr:T9SS type A sorting domain-containing protein [Chitinophagaceae bacterium]